MGDLAGVLLPSFQDVTLYELAKGTHLIVFFRESDEHTKAAIAAATQVWMNSTRSAGDLAVMAVLIDDPQNPTEVTEWDTALELPVIIAQAQDIRARLNLTTLPVEMVVSQQHIKWRHDGAVSAEVMQQAVEQHQP